MLKEKASGLLLDVFKEELEMKSKLLIPYCSSKFVGSARSYAGQGYCSICGKHQAEMMSQSERGRKAYCGRCAARRNFKKGDHVYAETENGSVPGRIADMGTRGGLVMIDDGRDKFPAEPSDLILQDEILEEDHGLKAGQLFVCSKTGLLVQIKAVKGDRIHCKESASGKRHVCKSEDLDNNFCDWCLHANRCGKLTRSYTNRSTWESIRRDGCKDFAIVRAGQ